MTTFLDDLGAPVELAAPVRRVISLVPSLTEALETTRPGCVIGATDYCLEALDLDVAALRGTKNPDRDRIVELAPDLVVANDEENRRLDVERLRAAGVPVWVTHIETVDEALESLTRLLTSIFDAAAPPWLEAARQAWAAPPRLAARVALPIWKDPWMWVGGRTYADDLLARVGLTNVVTYARYPALNVEAASAGADCLLLADEPYDFTDSAGDFPGTRTAVVEGRWLFWYGPAMVQARERLEEAVVQALPR